MAWNVWRPGFTIDEALGAFERNAARLGKALRIPRMKIKGSVVLERTFLFLKIIIGMSVSLIVLVFFTPIAALAGWLDILQAVATTCVCLMAAVVVGWPTYMAIRYDPEWGDGLA